MWHGNKYTDIQAVPLCLCTILTIPCRTVLRKSSFSSLPQVHELHGMSRVNWIILNSLSNVIKDGIQGQMQSHFGFLYGGWLSIRINRILATSPEVKASHAVYREYEVKKEACGETDKDASSGQFSFLFHFCKINHFCFDLKIVP